jgi:hypothetical protein
MAIKGKKISEELKKEAKKFKITLTEVKKGERTYKTEAKLRKEIEKAVSKSENVAKAKEVETPIKKEETKESNKTSKLDDSKVKSFHSNVMSTSRNANQLVNFANKTFSGLDVKVDKLNPKQVRFIVEGTMIPEEGYYTTK